MSDGRLKVTPGDKVVMLRADYNRLTELVKDAYEEGAVDHSINSGGEIQVFFKDSETYAELVKLVGKDKNV